MMSPRVDRLIHTSAHRFLTTPPGHGRHRHGGLFSRKLALLFRHRRSLPNNAIALYRSSSQRSGLFRIGNRSGVELKNSWQGAPNTPRLRGVDSCAMPVDLLHAIRPCETLRPNVIL